MFKKLFSPTDMTIGPPWKSIVIFTIPMLIGNIAQQLYSTVDSIIVGNTEGLGVTGLSAIGSAMPILNMLLVLFIGISAGASIMVSQYFGAKRREDLSQTIGNCITITIISIVALILIMTPFIRPILVALKTPQSTIDWCYDYLFISLVGVAGMAFYNILSGIIRGLGDSFSALLYLLIATVINIILDLILVRKMEVGGVALATVIAQLISSALCLWKLSRMTDCFDFKLKYLRPRAKYVKTIIKLGLPSGLTQMIFSSAMLVVQRLTNSFGDMFVAANVIVMRVDGFAMMPNFSFGTALTTYAGQNVGAGKYDRIPKGAKHGTLMAVGCSALLTLVILLSGKQIMGLFSNDAPEVIDMSYNLMKILAVGYIAMAVTQSLSGIMRGAGDTVTPMWISLITTILVRIPIAYGISYFTRTSALPYGQKECIQISLLITWIMGAVLTSIFYARGKWKDKAIN
ncbi:MAG: MATE family efflux transporter [Clostridia bacterium]|nr:MATE family efflux transporter [Clostridia bacterium]